jgi:hypothetical protein
MSLRRSQTCTSWPRSASACAAATPTTPAPRTAIWRERLPGAAGTLLAWCECGFNLVTTAQRLSIHRNTVIYRLHKVSRLTARDVRRPAVAIALYLAC